VRPCTSPAVCTSLSECAPAGIGRASRPFLQTMILDAGKGHKVMPGQAVMDARGMIGRIYLTGQRTSWVILLTDLNSRVPVTIASVGGSGNVQAMMTGDNTAQPILGMVSRIENLRAGDQVVSSGDGGFLPAGLPVGTVVEDRGIWRVTLLADPASSQDVEVLNFSQPPEALPPAAQLPAEAAGLKPQAAPPPPVTVPAPVAAKPVAPAIPETGQAPAAAEEDE